MERLMQIVEHPENYSEQEKEDILQDEECRKLYDTLVETLQAMASGMTDEEMQVPDVNKEWALFNSKSNTQLSSPFPTGESRSGVSPFRNIAAACIGLLCLSGVAFASIAIVGHYSRVEEKPVTEVTDSVVQNQKNDTVAAPVVSVVKESTDSIPTVYENAELQTILADISKAYGVEVEYQQEPSRYIRLYLQIKKEDGLDGAIGLLNHFEKVNIRKEGNKLIVE